MPTISNHIYLLFNTFFFFVTTTLFPKNLKSIFFPLSQSPHIPSNPIKTPIPSSKMDSLNLNRIFQIFDKNGDGTITTKELNSTLQNLGIYIPENDLTQMIQKIDVNGDGCVDIAEFSELYKSLTERKEEEEGEEEEEDDMKEAFNVFDQNGDGFITVDELKSVLESLGINHGRNVEDCKMMISKVDGDGDGRVSFMEFRHMMKSGGFSALG